MKATEDDKRLQPKEYFECVKIITQKIIVVIQIVHVTHVYCVIGETIAIMASQMVKILGTRHAFVEMNNEIASYRDTHGRRNMVLRLQRRLRHVRL